VSAPAGVTHEVVRFRAWIVLGSERGFPPHREDPSDDRDRDAQHSDERQRDPEDTGREQQREDRDRGHEHRWDHEADFAQRQEVERGREEEARDPAERQQEERDRGDRHEPAPPSREERGSDNEEPGGREHRLSDHRGRRGRAIGPRSEEEVPRHENRDAGYHQPPPAAHGGKALSADDRHGATGEAHDETDGEHGRRDMRPVRPDRGGDEDGREHDIADQGQKGAVDGSGQVRGREDRDLHGEQ